MKINLEKGIARCNRYTDYKTDAKVHLNRLQQLVALTLLFKLSKIVHKLFVFQKLKLPNVDTYAETIYSCWSSVTIPSSTTMNR